MKTFRLITVVCFLAFSMSCKTASETTSSETKSIATEADVEKAYALLSNVSEIGKCSWKIRWVEGQMGKRFVLEFILKEDGGEPYEINETFGNNQHRISTVDVKYSAFGSGDPYSLFLEKFETGTGFAHRYRLTYAIENGVFKELHVHVARGSSYSVVKDVTCVP